MSDPSLISKLPTELRWLYDQGIKDLASASSWLLDWDARSQPDVGFFTSGTRDLCWHISLLLEVLEGLGTAEELHSRYRPDFYLNSKYGVKLYFVLWSLTETEGSCPIAA